MNLDINDCENFGQVIDAVTAFELRYDERPQRLIVKRRVFAGIRENDPIIGDLYRRKESPFYFFENVIIYEEDIVMWQNIREEYDPLEFWLLYWASKDNIFFDLFGENETVKITGMSDVKYPDPLKETKGVKAA
jgi:hypothetical protein